MSNNIWSVYDWGDEFEVCGPSVASDRVSNGDQHLHLTDRTEAYCIAAAPDLLAALHDIATWLVSPSLDATTITEMQDKARAAIAKAEGSQS